MHMNESQNQQRILILDDDPLMLKMHATQLAKLGHTSPQCCDNAQSAMRFLDDTGKSCDLILLDINMPDMDGVEFIRHLADRKYRGAVVLISGESSRLLHTIERLGADLDLTILGRLEKPVSAASMAEVLRQWSEAHLSPLLPRVVTQYSAEELRCAIAQGELRNYYQPQVALLDGALIGVESLVRWIHTRDGLVPPASFIGLAEENGLIDALARNVLGEALHDAKVWDSIGLTPNISINLSVENLHHTEFSDYIISACSAAGVISKRIIIEVTESSIIGNRRSALDILARLGLKRFGLSLDDFGTGHSSLSRLQDIAFTELKIDYQFVHGVAVDPTRRAIFEASLALARDLQMSAVAEGVEDRADWDFLRATNCDYAQGYFIGHPMPADKLPSWLAQWQARLDDLLK
jgi:EAL domain-containing protein (putative c-di-GMP-specific phosphodiesterase class I)/CheY-like chemotaxis protein